MPKEPHNLSDRRTDVPPDLPDVHMNRRTKVCIWIIILGLGNFLAYSLAYFSLPGEAVHGGVTLDADGRRHYYLLDQGDRIEVARGAWIYSAAHSTTIPVTVGAVLLAMLTLAKDRIVSSLRSSAVRGRTFITILAAVVTVSSVGWMAWFVYVVLRQLRDPPGPVP